MKYAGFCIGLHGALSGGNQFLFLYMKTYCKPGRVDILNPAFNLPATHKAFRNKLKNGNKAMFQQLLLDNSSLSLEELHADLQAGEWARINTVIDKINEDLTARIATGCLDLEPIRQFYRYDGIAQKRRLLSIEGAAQQIYEYIAVEALMPLFNAKLLPCQHGSIPGRGAVTVKEAIENYVRKARYGGHRHALKMDVEHAYQSTRVDKVMELLERDIGKNKPLLKFLRALMSNYPGGALCIGGYLPTWLFNYVMSYMLREILTYGQERRGTWTAYARHIACYADDVAIFGAKGQLRKVHRRVSTWSKERLGLTVKARVIECHFYTFAQEKAESKRAKARGQRPRIPTLDMGGYRVSRRQTTVRRKIYRRMRRQVLRGIAELRGLGYTPWWRSQVLMSYHGYIKHTDNTNFKRKYGAGWIRAARESISWYARKKASA